MPTGRVPGVRGRASTFERRFRPLETNFSESKPILSGLDAEEGCCSARSGTAMDLGLDYCRVLLALGFVSSWVLHTKIGMAGRGHWGKPPGL